MPVPSNRDKILPARGNYADLAAGVADILDGEICYAIDQDQYYQKEGTALVAVGATKAQGLLADTAIQPTDGLDAFDSVTLSGLVSGHSLSWNGSSWINAVPGAAATTSLTDVSVTSASDNQILRFNAAINEYYPEDLAVPVWTLTTDQLAGQAGATAADKAAAAYPNLNPAAGATPITGEVIVATKTGGTNDTAYAGAYHYNGTQWLQVQSGGTGSATGAQNYRAALADPQIAGKTAGDLDIVLEANDHRLNVYDGASYQELFGEGTIKSWIAAGSLFQGVVTSTGDIGTLPAPSVGNKGYYWTWTGPANTAVSPGAFTNGGGFSATLQVGDWIQSNGSAYVHIPSDLLSKLRWESLGSFKTWAAGSWERDSLVIHSGRMYRAIAAIAALDAAPDSNANWLDITPDLALEDLSNVDNATPTAGQVLTWSQLNTRWEPAPAVTTIEDALDSTVTSPADGEVLSYDSGTSKWVNQPISFSASDLTYVTINSVADGEVLQYDAASAKWQNVDYKFPLSDLTDTTIGGASEGHTLHWDATTSKWMNSSPVDTLGGLTDVTLAAASNGEGLIFDGTSNKWKNLPIVRSLGDLTDTGLSAPVANQVLRYNGTSWINVTPDYLTPTTGYTQAQVDTLVSALSTNVVHSQEVLDIANTPPSSPALDDAYIVGTAPTGVWVGQDNQLAEWDGAAWAFTAPANQETHLVRALSENWLWTGTAWVKVAAAAATIGQLNDVTVATPTEGQILTYNAAGSNWVNTDSPSYTKAEVDAKLGVPAKIVALSTADYNALSVKDPNTLYVLT